MSLEESMAGDFGYGGLEMFHEPARFCSTESWWVKLTGDVFVGQP